MKEGDEEGEGGSILVGVLELCAHGHDCGCGCGVCYLFDSISGEGNRLLVEVLCYAIAGKGAVLVGQLSEGMKRDIYEADLP